MMLLWPGIDSSSEVAIQKARQGQNSRRANNGLDTSTVEAKATLGTSAPEVKPKQPLFVVGDAEAKLSIASAMKLGYRFVLGGDGDAAVTNPDGRTYHIHRFLCDCPDKLGRGGSYTGRCKHEVWISQIRPCDMCGGFMLLGEFRTAFGETLRRFECDTCGNARDADLVRQERKALKEGQPQGEALTPEGRCAQAIVWLDAWGRTRYVWNVVTQSPELAPTMVRLLVDAGKDILAAQIAQRYRTGVKVA